MSFLTRVNSAKLLEYILDFLLLPSRPVLSLCDTFGIAAGGINPRA